MSVRSEKNAVPMNATDSMALAISDAQPMDASLSEGAAFATAQAENPLSRTVVVSVRASLNDLCLQKQKGTWAPSGEAMRSILQSKKVCGLVHLSTQAPTHLLIHVANALLASHTRSTRRWTARRNPRAT